jgi:N-methylhydantoinase B
MEAEHPVRVEAYALVPDSCGAGRWRGGVGIMRSYRVLAEEALLQLRSDRVVFAPYGLAGGSPGGRSRTTLTVDGTPRDLPGKVTMAVARDDLIEHIQAGAGGYGDPFAREPERIREDVLDGKITPAFALEHHGVAIDQDGNIDQAATQAVRAPSPALSSPRQSSVVR